MKTRMFLVHYLDSQLAVVYFKDPGVNEVCESSVDGNSSPG